MTVQNVTNFAASVYSRLKNLSQKKGGDFNRLLMRYAIERFLYRIAQSPSAENFVLKGGNLFIVWQNGDTARTTMDSDFLFFGDASEEHLRSVFSEIAHDIACPEDGMRYDAETIAVSAIRQDTEYGGTRVTMNAYLGTARILMQFDIGIGDAITPGPIMVDFPVLLPLPVPRLKSYPAVTSIAEKVDNMLVREMDNSRMKDFYDIWLLSMLFPHDLHELRLAIRNTLNRRGTALPEQTPISLTKAFADNVMKQTQWKAFLRKNGLTGAPKELKEVIDRLAAFLLPALQGDSQAANWDPCEGAWNPAK